MNGPDFNDICNRLPEGWSISIELWNDSADATLYDPAGEEVDINPDSDSLENLVQYAIRESQQP